MWKELELCAEVEVALQSTIFLEITSQTELLHQIIRQLTATFLSGMDQETVCGLK